jgi:hypothetical protein
MNGAAPAQAPNLTGKWSLKAHLNWKIAICSHPMYLLVDEDRGKPVVGERIPPWGAPTAEAYVKRVRRNLVALEQSPQRKLNYEWSACELESLAQRFPDVICLMRRACRRGQLDFVGGEYSQPHASTLTSESGWRQYEEGLDVFRRLLGKRMTVHATQECHLQPQQPQLLRHFGFRYLVLPAFAWAVRITQGPFELLGQVPSGLYLKRGDEFIHAEALDGTTIPAYFPTHARHTDPVAEEMKGFWSCPPVWIDFPDLSEYENPLGDRAAAVLLEDALNERFQAAPPRARGQVHTYWSYVEGVWAEELLRCGRSAEGAATLAGNLLAMTRLAGVPVRQQSRLRGIWRTILKYQHHDVMWIEVTDLRRKAIEKFKETIAGSHCLLARAAGRLARANRRTLTVFNGVARPRNVLLELNADQIPAGGTKFQRHGTRCLGFRRIPAGGFTSFPLAKDGCSASRETALPSKLTTRHYTVRFSTEGLIRQIATAGHASLLSDTDYLGGELRAVIRGKWVNNRPASCHFYAGPVCDVLERSASLGRIPVRERYLFFKAEPVIKVELEFDFHGDTVGDFHIEETKINVYYPTAKSAVYHDVPFGYVQAREDEQLLATHWVYSGGLVYVNRGTPKHWVRNGVLANTLAWGGRRFSNRMHANWRQRTQYDLRLSGRQKVEYFLLPCGAFHDARIVHAVEALTAPVFLAQGEGQRSFYEVKDRRLAVTSVYQKRGQIWARGYQLPSRTQARFRDWEIFNVPLDEITKQPVRRRHGARTGTRP